MEGFCFIDIGKTFKPEITWASGKPYREMEFFIDEWWEILHKGKKVASRFEDEKADKLIKEINNVKKLIKPMEDCKVVEVREYTGISFGLSFFGDEEWLLSINSEWD